MSERDDTDIPMVQTPLEKRFESLITPFQAFIKDQTISSSILVLCTGAALVIANSPLAAAYEAVLHTSLGFVYGSFSFTLSVRHWINEGLMALFFFLLGLEIKRELLVGDLNDARRAVPVIAAALGGMLGPALIYYSLNVGTPVVHGWGIPMATDTAFAVGVIALLGRRIPPAAMLFLTALAIIDDLGAILVIAVFYSDSISVVHLSLSAIALSVLILSNVLGFRRPGIYIVGGLFVWLGMLGSGVHATVAGILVAAAVPARPKRASGWFLRRTHSLMERFAEIENDKDANEAILGKEEQHAVVEQVGDAAEKATTPLRRWERALEHPISLIVLPVFALANAGIPVSPDMVQSLWTGTLAPGIVSGLVIGKAVGIPFFAWLAVRLRLGYLPTGLYMRHLIGIGLLGGMGFTMSIFIAGLGFADMPNALLVAKSSILLASLIAGAAGYLWLRIRG